MNTEKVYVLKKDLPGAIAGDEFEPSTFGMAVTTDMKLPYGHWPVYYSKVGVHNCWVPASWVKDENWFTPKQPVEDKPKEGVATYQDGFQAGIYWCKKYGIPDVPPTLERQDSKEDWEVISFWCNNKLFSFDGIQGGYYSETGSMTGFSGTETIYSVRRKSDGEVFVLGDKVMFNGEKCNYDYFSIDNFFLMDNGGLLARSSSAPDAICELIGDLKKQPKEESKPFIDNCGVCGGEMCYIRGKYPNTDKRKVCPTCAIERLEQISEIADKNYGKTSQSIS